VQHRVIRELMLLEFELDYSAAEATLNFCSAKGEGTFDQSTVAR